MQVQPGADGIQKLLAAETEAQRIVSDSRKAKQDRLRQAKAEAEREIAAYRAEREGAYQKKLSEGTSGAQATAQRLANDTALQIQNIQAAVKAKKAQVVDLLVGYTSTVRFN
uniref:V-type proton ATPase subunit G n=1 Tax=Chlamydomonas leiostraca TaxID=1034604 RepID=A0A7S0RMW3_9CHLO|mmetsp:Transcript_27071/g.68817  ORF Transcript_27071/g.68817 Transcript_27071/m.68817 type:complete len:112 (+) Transcript_27071:52-387(+)